MRERGGQWPCWEERAALRGERKRGQGGVVAGRRGRWQCGGPRRSSPSVNHREIWRSSTGRVGICNIASSLASATSQDRISVASDESVVTRPSNCL
ncbi:hypothetical protein TIFTF001_009072 [Ficus carica]|uniref:Uncharacterized protein n=1 Tax=Ficus carica TaxID=3494 RepID=A0AA87ZT96_FICCA|nr:hypothetical protein TIFTF001_009072 [Ficus carica]